MRILWTCGFCWISAGVRCVLINNLMIAKLRKPRQKRITPQMLNLLKKVKAY
jgi:hypothetical protein